MFFCFFSVIIYIIVFNEVIFDIHNLKKGKTMKEKKKKPKEQEDNEKKENGFLKQLNKRMPIVLSVLVVVVLFSLLRILGSNNFIRAGLMGGFSAFGSYFLVLLLLYHAFMWLYDSKLKIRLRRVICSIMTVVGVSTLQHLIEYSKYAADDNYKLITNGQEGHGGGLFGGIIGEFFANSAISRIGGIIVVLIILLFMFLQMFNITPASMLRSDEKSKKKKKPKKKKRKKLDVYDDGDDDSEETFVRKTKNKSPDYFDLSKYIEEENRKKEEGLQPKEKEQEENDDSYEDFFNSSFNKENDSKQEDNESRSSFNVTKERVTDEPEQKAPNQYKPEEDTSYQYEPQKAQKDYFDPEEIFKPSENKESYTEPQKEQFFYEPEEEPSFHQSKDEEAFYKPNEEEVYYNPQQKNDSFSDYVENDEEETTYFNPEKSNSYEEKKKEESFFEFDTPKNENIDTPKPIFEPYDDSEEEDEPEDESYEYDDDEDTEDYEDEAVNEYYGNQNDSDYEEKEEKEEKSDFDKYISREIMERLGKAGMAPKPSEPVREDRPAPPPPPPTPPPPPPKPKPIKRNYVFPPLSFLQAPSVDSDSDEAQSELQENARIIVETLNNFNARTRIDNITRGPTVTRYELVPEPGVRVRSIANLVDDIAMNLAAEGIRIECPIPGKSAVGIEVPNKVTSMVYLRELLEDQKFKSAKGPMTCALGKSISGENIYVDIEKTPHLLIAGATGMGKSVCINSLLVSLLYKATPDDVRLILIDPKRVELSNYNGVPHLLVPVVCEPKKSLGALQWAVTEMESRFETIEAAGVRNLHEFNEKIDNGYEAEKMARILIVIDELADLKMAVPDIEGHITRLTQKARAAGIHIIIGTQRPSVDVITGLIKSNIPSRIAFRVPSQVDSRTILDEVGAEKLVSRGDMLVKIVGALRPARVQGSFVKASEIQYVIDFWKENSPAIYDEEVMHQIDSNAAKLAKNDKELDDDGGSDGAGDDELDSAFYDALELATEMGKISSSFLQRKLRLGFQRAARIIDQMEDCGYIGEANGSKPRDVLITKEDYQEIVMRRNGD